MYKFTSESGETSWPCVNNLHTNPINFQSRIQDSLQVKNEELSERGRCSW